MLTALLRSTSSSATACRGAFELQQCVRCLPMQSEYSSRARGMLTGHRACTSGPGGFGSCDSQESHGLAGKGNLDPNIVSVSLLVDTLQLMKKFEVLSSSLLYLRSSRA